MKLKYLLPVIAFFIVLGTGLLQAQLTQSENYIYSKTVVTKSSDSLQKDTLRTVTYFDGLGRPKQNIAVYGAGNGKDLVTPITYDGFGRQVLDILPIPVQSTNRGYNSGITDEGPANGYYFSKGLGGNAYSEKILESSPLDRIQQQIQPGNDWREKPVHFYYATNGQDEVYRFTTTTIWENGATKSTLSMGIYPPSTLYKTVVTDEDGSSSEEFKNGEGQTVLVRKNDGTQNIDTYYVYNEYNQLSFVIPPKAVHQSPTEQLLDNLCYQYRYDGKNRLIEKKLPGKGWEYMVYDRMDRLILTQDANLRAAGKWMITKYDKFGRVLYTALIAGSTRSAMQNQCKDLEIIESRDTTGFTKNELTVYYTNVYFVSSDTTVLSVNYYDTYPTGTPFPNQNKIFNEPILTDAYVNNRSVKSLPTASFVKNINDDNWTKNYTFYDTKGRPIGMHSTNHLGGSTVVHSRLDFTGLVTKTKTYHKRLNTDTVTEIEENFVYDDQKRLTEHYHEVKGKSPKELLVKNSYNELGQLNIKEVGATNTSGTNYTAPLQNINYNYNIRGWMTGINLNVSKNLDTGKLFSYKIRYTDTQDTSKKRYNGNIGEIDWTYGTTTSNRYDYTYDRLNRLLKADFKSVSGTGSTDSKFYNEELTYDKNGNITNLKRYGKTSASPTTGTLVDNLDYTYAGSNMVTAIADVTGNTSGYKGTGLPITYDANGNMLTFADKGITQNIVYNHLNLPQQILQNSNTATYTYRADGVKVKKHSVINNESLFTEYLDGFVYTSPYTAGAKAALEQDDDETRETVTGRQEEAIEAEVMAAGPGNPPTQYIVNLSFFPTAEGFYDYENFKYIYQYKDHLGNVRLSYSRTATGGIKQEDKNDYYPFGLNFITNVFGGGSLFSPVTTYKNYKYNGKELQETGMYDYGARMYMADVARWGVVDPLAETSRRWSPFTYAYNNPIRFIDPDGMQNEDWVKKDNQWTYRSDITTSEQAKTEGYDDFAKNGTVLSDARIGSDGEAGYVRLNEGGTADYLPNKDFQDTATNSLTAFSTSLPTFGSIYSRLKSFFTSDSDTFTPLDSRGGTFQPGGNEFFRPGKDRVLSTGLFDWFSPLTRGRTPDFLSGLSDMSSIAEMAKSDLMKSSDTFSIYADQSTGVETYKNGNRITGYHVTSKPIMRTGLSKQQYDSINTVLKKDSAKYEQMLNRMVNSHQK